ncbi:MAG: hypothetical protein CMF94_02735 [Candidatus Marinimicrobia bacterium]|nr:hypothetical protein [Candidatus Neomarinimicrobiota bacterium]
MLLCKSDDISYLRNGADALMRQMLSSFGISGLFWMGGGFLIGSIAIYLIQKFSWEEYEIKSSYFVSMVIESILWSYLLFIFMSNMHLFLMAPIGYKVIQNVTLAIGAGIYEEILFRVVLIFLLNYILSLVFQWKNYLKNSVSIILASIFFSLFHFIGEFGDYYSFNIFMIRFLAGIYLGVLYCLRGFGIAAWSHSLYDLLVLTRITTQ